MEASKGRDSVTLPLNIPREVLRFMDVKDYSIFRDNETKKSDTIEVQDHRVDFIKAECAWLGNQPELLYGKIDDLANLSASLDKYLTECSSQRCNDLMNTSLYMNFRSKMSTISLASIKNLRKSFDDYKYSTVHDSAEIIKLYQRLETMRDARSLLNTIRTLYKLYENIRSSKTEKFHSIIVLASVLYHFEAVAKLDSRISSTIIFNTIKERLTYTCRNLINGLFFKCGTKFNLQQKVKLLLLLGQPPEYAAKNILGLLQTELISISSFVLQKYITAEHLVNLSQNEAFPHIVGPRDISIQARMIGSNVLLLVICKLLSDYVSFFKKVFSELFTLDEDSLFLTQDLEKFSKLYNIPVENFPILSRLNDLPWIPFYSHVCSLIKRDVFHLAFTTFEILTTILHNCNLSTLNDDNDIIKMALLLRFYIIYHDTNLSHTSHSPTNNFEPIDHNNCTRDLIKILTTLSEIPLLHNGIDFNKSNNNALKTLEIIISTKLERCLDKCFMEDIQANFTSLETFDRIEHYSLGAFKDVFSAAKHFSHIVNNMLVNTDNTVFSSTNPYHGWTPNAAFTGFNLNISSPALHGNTHALQKTDTFLPKSFLSVNYGGLYTGSSKKLMEHFETFYRVMLVQPENAMEVVVRFTNMVDQFIYRSIHSCGIHTSVIETLDKFKNVFKMMRDKNPKVCKFSSISTTSSIDHNTTNLISGTNTNISQLYFSVNAIESGFTILESLRVLMENNTGEVHRFLGEYYDERLGVIAELRSVVYYISMYNLLRPKLPTVKILQILKSSKIVDAGARIGRLFSEFEMHLNTIQNSLEGAGINSLPIIVKIHLWDSTTRVIKDSFKPVLDMANNDVNCHIQGLVNDGYAKALRITDAVCRRYIDNVKCDYLNNKTEIANMGTYHILVNKVINRQYSTCYYTHFTIKCVSQHL
ncbi:hypothetical protein BEWA_034000 [Theileria equi strain WA]|uniref:Uncharacterized protein n=1 Tax=Theileria equi strain WA TaxID=1537102 RepID=L0AZ67_THEEQ|nr:hypothetical protein BEWA_034000 [Theileria equi strain WA]AFZ80543.1 hypothetical protein BEWA_034000 [Theileria equi strain WA]|eukprot:XP_004830209.1 hypothetical protein BEWA_034000 [Theileria equi strain WA]